MSDFEIKETGAWVNPKLQGHLFDYTLGNAIIEVFKKKGVKKVVDIGCGPGFYVKALKSRDFYVKGYDGNPFTEQITKKILNDGSYCEVFDFTRKVRFSQKFDAVLSLEVGEHIPKRYEDVFLDNLVNSSSEYILLSWAIEGQKGNGHVNCRSNEYIISKMDKIGFTEQERVKVLLRNKSSLPWFKNTIMFFKKRLSVTPFISLDYK